MLLQRFLTAILLGGGVRMEAMPEGDEIGLAVSDLDLPQDVLDFIVEGWGIERL